MAHQAQDGIPLSSNAAATPPSAAGERSPLPELRRIVEGLTQITGIPSSILAVDGRVIACAGWQEICTRFHQANPDTLKLCNDTGPLSCCLSRASTEGAETPEPQVGPCGNHLWGAEVPVVAKDQVAGIVALGQVLIAEEPPEPEVFREHAQRYGFPEDEYLAALAKVPVIPRETFSHAISLVTGLAGLISEALSAQQETIEILEKVKSSERSYASLLQAVPVGVAVSDGRVMLHVNEEFCRILGYAEDELVGRRTRMLYPSETEDEEVGSTFAGLRERPVGEIETRMVRKDGTVIDILLRLALIDPARPALVTAAILDITEQKRSRRALEEREAQLSAIIRSAPAAVVQIDLENRVVLWNPAAESILGWTAAEVLGRQLPFVSDRFVAESFRLHRDGLVGVVHQNLHLESVRRDGKAVDINLSAARVEDAEGQAMGTLAVFTDVSEWMQLTREVRQRARRQTALARAALALAQMALRDATKDTVRQQLSTTLATLARGAEADVADLHLQGADWDGFRVRATVGTEKTLASTPALQVPVVIDNAVHGTLSFFDSRSESWGSDHLEWGQTAAALIGATLARIRAAAESRRLQDQLLQAQRLESVGRLAGGVAHDFNNMLQTIIGNCDLALADMSSGHPLRLRLEDIRAAAERSARLTSQLLAFSQQQMMAPRVLDINETISSLLASLSALVSEKIEFVWLPGRDVWPVCLDPIQLYQILANLVINSCDAIEGAGTIVIETANVVLDSAYCARQPDISPGQYVLISVSDTGHGMDAETLARAFDPFFTSKSPGQGTGLGLSTVHGIVLQNGGAIHAYSEPGRGTTMKIYLPRCTSIEASAPKNGTAGTAEAQTLMVDRPEEPRRVPAAQATILVVEDEPAVRTLLERQLAGFGYLVLAASGPEEALALAAKHEDSIDLLLTDLVMAGMHGRELARRMTELCPGIACVFTSGYTKNLITQQELLKPGFQFLQKPFTQSELRSAVEQALGTLDPGGR